MNWTASELIRQVQKQAIGAGLKVDCAASGNVNARIAIVSDYPGQTEVQLKMPQVGAGGRYLWEQLKPYGISRNDVWVTNVIKRQVLEADDSKSPVPTGELQHWHSVLRWELSQLPNLQIILCLGAHAARFFIADGRILRWRGSKVLWADKQVFIGVNPALIIREPKWDIVFRIDMKKFSFLTSGRWNEKATTIHINPSEMEAIEYLEYLGRDDRPISIDIETASDETACIGFANSSTEAMCINFRSYEGHHYDREAESRIRKRIARLVSDDTKKFVGQNCSFDAGWLWWKDRIRIKKFWMDTLLAHHTLYPPLPHNLGFLTSVYTFHPYYKDEKDSWKEVGDLNAFWEYNGKDCAYTWEIADSLNRELVSNKLDGFFYNHVMKLQPWLIMMMIHGVKADTVAKEKLATRLRLELEGGKDPETGAEIEGLLQKFWQAVAIATGEPDYKPNPNSPKQMKELYFEKLRLVGRGTSTNKDNRVRMISHYKTNQQSRNVIMLHDEFQKEHKFVSTYAEIELDDDGRFRTEYKQYGVQSAPGRLSSTQTHWGTGGNLQNQPERAKPMYIADEGYRFIYFDLSQAEARVVGWDAEIPSWIEQFERARIDGKYDCHRALASEMFKVPYDQVPLKDRDENLNPTIRYIAKRCRHGLNYRMGPDRLATVTKLPLQDAYKAYEIYHQITPELKRWWERIIEEVKTNKVLYSHLGRRWILLERFDESALESIVAFVPQSTIGDKVAQIEYQAYEHPDWDHEHSTIILNNHDSLIAMVLDDDKEATKHLSILKHYAEQPIKIRGRDLIIPAEVAWSYPGKDDGVHRWSTIKKLEHFESCF
jgi:uracil-DNA glycosylase family 4